MALAAGARLGPYEILAPIGAGGMGEVYRAHDSRLGRDVAIKVSKEQFSERFEREARAIAALSDPHICHLYDVGPNYLVMELVDGVPLKGPLPLEKAIDYARQILDALDAAHSKGITHRDLKPANILVTKSGIKLLDFGLAKRTAPLKETDTTNALTSQGQILGTLQYMSPEQLQGKEIDVRSDLFSFGCVLYEMLTGKRAFEGANAASVVAAILEREPAPIPAQTSMDRILKRCLAKDPDQRFQTAKDLKAALSWAQEQPPPGGNQPKSMLSWVITGGLALVLVALTAFFWRDGRSNEPRVMRFNLDLGPDVVAGQRITATISPDGSRLVYSVRGSNGKPQLATRTLDQPQATLLAGTEDAMDPFFSPDSQWIGFFVGSQIKKIAVQGGGVVTVCETGGEGRGASWGEDGQIVFTGRAVGLYRVPDSGGSPQSLTTPGPGEVSHRWPQILPGGKAVLFTSSTTMSDYENGMIEALTLKTGKWKVVHRGGYFGRYVSGHLLYVHQGTLFGVPFDPERLDVTGTPAPLLENLDANASYASGQFESSTNGVLVYVRATSADFGWPIVWLDSSGKTQPLAPAADYHWLALSPDGKRLLVRLQDDVQIYDIEHGRMTRLTFNRNTSLSTWTPDGQHVVFSSTTPSGFALQWIRADGAGEVQTLLEAKEQLLPISFSPDGTRLAFTKQTGGSTYAWTLPLDLRDPEHPKPGKPDLFLETPAYQPTFSPDGRWISYLSPESGRFEAYVRPFPGPGGKWQISNDGSEFAIWSRTAPELFFESQGRIMVSAYTIKGDSFQAAKPRAWSNFQPPGLQPNAIYPAPDGKRIVAEVVPASESNAPVHVTLILNFFDLLRRRAPVTK